FSTECDWVSYFAHTHRLITYQPLPEPDRTPGAVVQAHDQTGSDEGLTFPLDWGSGSQEERWIRWIQRTVVGRNSAVKNNFQQLRLHRSTDHQAADQFPDARQSAC